MKYKFLNYKILIIFLIIVHLVSLQKIPISSLQDQYLHLRKDNIIEQRSVSGGWIFAGFILGPILFIFSFILIWFNQKKAALDNRRLKLAQEICVDINPYTPDNIYQNNNKLVYAIGQTVTNQIIADPLSGISVDKAIKIVRSVQVVEIRSRKHQSDHDSHADYQYSWVKQHQTNVYLGNNNPTWWFIKSDQILAKSVQVGGCYLSNQQKKICHKYQPLYPQPENASQISQITQRSSNYQITDAYLYFASPIDGSFHGLGALRIRWYKCPTGPISLIAELKNNTFQPFPIASYQNNGVIEKDNLPNICCCCMSNCTAQLLQPIEQINLIEQDKLSRQEVISNKIDRSLCIAKVLRFVAFFLMVAGICLFFSPITYIIGFVPIIGGFIAGAIGSVIFLAALIISIPLFLIMVSLAWLCFRPKIGLIILAIGLTILTLVLVLTKGGKSQSTKPAHDLIESLLFKSQ